MSGKMHGKIPGELPKIQPDKHYVKLEDQPLPKLLEMKDRQQKLIKTMWEGYLFCVVKFLNFFWFQVQEW